jgi:hypothetical protein
MKNPKVLLMTVLVVVLAAVGAGVGAEGTVRAGRLGADLRFDYGASAGDPIAQIGIDAEYGLLERLTVGAGFAYVDGYMTQESCLELMVKGFLLGRPLDAFAAAALQLHFAGGLGSSGTLRAGVEWQSPWKFFLGAEAAVLFEQAGIGWLGGAFAGIRL